MAQWVECQPANHKVSGLIPGQGTYPGCGSGPHLRVRERQPMGVSLTHRCFSPFLSPSVPLSLKVWHASVLEFSSNIHYWSSKDFSRLWKRVRPQSVTTEPSWDLVYKKCGRSKWPQTLKVLWDLGEDACLQQPWPGRALLRFLSWTGLAYIKVGHGAG